LKRNIARLQEFIGLKNFAQGGADYFYPDERQFVIIAPWVAQSAKSITFDEVTRQFIVAREAGWRNAEHRRQWQSTLATYAWPVLGKLPVNVIDRDLVLKVLDPIWSTQTETASRLRGRIEQVLDWAKERGLRSGENPARWKGGLEHVYQRRSKLQPTQHHAALPFDQLPEFMAAVRERETIAAYALEFLISTAARASEVRFATWAEIDREAKTWTVPGNRMKSGKPHRVPLSDRAVEIFDIMKSISSTEYVFPGLAGPLSGMAMRLCTQRIHPEITVHGFRSSFRDWCAERTNFPREIAEAALAHATSDSTERAYRRGDALEQRRRLMDAWAAFCAQPIQGGGKVIAMNSRIPAAESR
jgi:integrase